MPKPSRIIYRDAKLRKPGKISNDKGVYSSSLSPRTYLAKVRRPPANAYSLVKEQRNTTSNHPTITATVRFGIECFIDLLSHPSADAPLLHQ